MERASSSPARRAASGARPLSGFAERGACLTLAARREGVVREAAAACEGKGGKAIAARADVTDPAAMQALTRRAIEASGIIDV